MALLEKPAVQRPQAAHNPADDSVSNSSNSSSHPSSTVPRKQKQPTPNTRRRIRELLWMCLPKHETSSTAATTSKNEPLGDNHDRHNNRCPHHHHHHEFHNDENKSHLTSSSNTVLTTKPSASTIDPATSTRILNTTDSMNRRDASDGHLDLGQHAPPPALLQPPLQPQPPLPLPPISSTTPTQQQTNPYQLHKHEYFQELGYMKFGCETMAEAQALALSTHKPLLAIETRIPGDADAGRDVFSHPLIVEASQSLFVPVVRIVPQAEDEKERRKNMGSGAAFVERAPSGKPCRTKVAFLDPHSGGFLTEPLYGDKLTRACMLSAMVQVLDQWYNNNNCSKNKNKEACASSLGMVIPKYLTLLYQEETGKVDLIVAQRMNRAPRQRECTTFFGTEDSALGEVEFAGMDGVFATRAVFVHGRRGVEVCYDTNKIAYCSLVRHALRQDLASKVFYKTNDEKRAAEVEIARVEDVSPVLEQFNGDVKPDYCNTKRALRKTPLRFVPMVDIQATKTNRLVHLGRFNEAMHLLSPQQGVILMQAMQRCGRNLFHEVVDVPVIIAWMSVSEGRHPQCIASDYARLGEDDEEDKSDEEFECEGLSSQEFSVHSHGSLTSVR